MNHGSQLRIPTPRPAARTLARRALVTGALALVLALLGGGAPAWANALKDGKDALAAGRFDDAVAAYRTATTEAPNDAQAWLGLGLALEKKRQWQAALEAFQKASTLDARLADPSRGQGAMLLRLDRPAEAEAAFRKAVEIDRKFPAAQLGLGDALVRQKKIPEALAVYEAGVRFGSKTAPDFYKGLGEAQAARDSVQAAELWLLKARESATTMPPSVQGPIFRALGDLYMQRKIPELAIVNYEQAKGIDGGDLDTRMALGNALYQRGRYNEALAEYKAVVEADPQYAEGYLKLGNLYYLASQSDPPRVNEAIEILDKLLALEPNNLEGKALLAQALFRTGRAAEKQRAATLLDEIEKTGQFPPAAWRTRAVIFYENSDFKNAIAAFHKAGKLEIIDLKRLADAYRRVGAEEADTTRKSGFYEAADSVYVTIIDRDSSTADGKKASVERARLRYLMKDYPGAVERFNRVIALDPNSGEAYYYLGLSKRALGDDAGGLAAIQKAVALEPKQAGWYLQLGAVQSKLKATEEARAAFRQAAALDDSTTVGAIARQQLGFFELVGKNHPEAIRLLEESARIDAKQYQTWLWLGQAHQNSKQIEKAVEAYRKVQQLKPGEPNSQKQLQQLGK